MTRTLDAKIIGTLPLGNGRLGMMADGGVTKENGFCSLFICLLLQSVNLNLQ
ncbi:MAG: hypothetical protein JWP94_2068 [Mucilaginibacter sp.]|nr:hypothetical protein [Mucilaginibacter sp.]